MYRPYVGYIYRYSYNGKSYIGSTTNLKHRKEEHKTNLTNKFGKAIKQIGCNNFKFDVIDTLHFNDRNDLFDLENQYIIKYDSISNGWNWRKTKKPIIKNNFLVLI